MRDKIILSAMEQIKKYGFRRFTIKDITADLGISSKTVYKYFDGKDDIISAVCTSFIAKEKERILGILESDSAWMDKMTAIISGDPARIIELKKHYPAEWQKFMDMQRFLSRQKRSFIEQGIASGDIRPDIDIDLLGTIIHTCVEALINLDDSDPGTEQVLAEFWKMVMYGVLSCESKIRELDMETCGLPKTIRGTNHNLIDCEKPR